MLLPFFKAVILIPITLLPILNPLATSPIYASLLGNISSAAQKKVARQVAINCWFLLMAAMFIGSHVLNFFGISLPIVRIAGGIIVAAAGWRLLGDNGNDEIRTQVATNAGGEEEWSDEEFKIRSFYPISFPLTVGPGTIAASIALGTNTSTKLFDWARSMGSAALGAALTALVVFLCYRNAHRLVAFLGRLGTLVLLRLSAFILLCIGIEILWQGVSGLLIEAGVKLS
ncbi:MAG TPA: MarC family protein [Burkholderiaceae bacterium]